MLPRREREDLQAASRSPLSWQPQLDVWRKSLLLLNTMADMMENPNGTAQEWLHFLQCCQHVRSGGHARMEVGQLSHTAASYAHSHGWGAGAMASSILSLQARSVPFPLRHVMTSSTAQRYHWPRQPGPRTSALPFVPQTPPSTVQQMHSKSPGPPHHPWSSCTLQERSACCSSCGATAAASTLG